MSAVDEGSLNVVVDRFYEAAVCPELWQSVLHETSLALGAEGATILCQPNDAMPAVYSAGIAELIDAFVREGWENIRASRGIGKGRWNLHSESTIFASDELDRLPFYSDLLGRLGFRWFVGTTLAKVDGKTTILSVERLAREEPFSRRELSAIEAILPHLRRAAGLALRFGLARGEGMLEAFDRLGCGAFLLDQDGKAIRLNAEARQLLGNGLSLERGRLAANAQSTNNALQRLVRNTIAPGVLPAAQSAASLALPRINRRPIIAYGVPITGSAQDVFQRAKAVLILIDLDQRLLPAEITLRNAFGLTSGEARLAAAVGSGASPREAAGELEVTTETARTVLKRVFAKVGVSRQSELVSLLTRLMLK